MNTPNESKRPSVAKLLEEVIRLMERPDVMPSPLGGCNMCVEHFMSLLHDLKCTARELDAAQLAQAGSFLVTKNGDDVSIQPLPAQAGEAIELRYCEIHKLCLHPNQPYIFTVDAECPSCVALVAEHDEGMAPLGCPATAKFTPHPQPEQPASAVDDDEMDGGCSTCNGLGLANVIDPSDCALVMDDCPECGGEGAAQSPAVSPPSVVAVSEEAVTVALDAFSNAWRQTPAYAINPASGEFGRPQMRAALESFASRMGSGERDAVLKPFIASLYEFADKQYIRALDDLRRDPCLGWEHKVKEGKFGEAEFNAHKLANQCMGAHYGIYNAVRAAIAAHTAAGNGDACTAQDDTPSKSRTKRIAAQSGNGGGA